MRGPKVVVSGLVQPVRWRRLWNFVWPPLLLYSCRAAGQTKMGVRRIPIPEIQAMIACKNCVWLVFCGRSDRLIVGGWIYSKPVGWFVCLLASVVWSDLWSVVGLSAGLFAIQSVGRLNHPGGLLSNLSPTDQPIIHSSI